MNSNLSTNSDALSQADVLQVRAWLTDNLEFVDMRECIAIGAEVGVLRWEVGCVPELTVGSGMWGVGSEK